MLPNPGLSTPVAAPVAWPQIPSWQLNELQKLWANNQLFGVSPQIIGAIDQAESSGTGGSINPQGYGGWFGLGAGSSYPGTGATVTASLLHGTDPTSFDQQAQIAAGEFANLLAANQDNPYKAEAAYQGGGGAEGQQVFASLGIAPQDIPSSLGVSAGTGATLTGATKAQGKAPETTFGKVIGTLDAWMNPDAPSLYKTITTLGTANLQTIAVTIFSRTAFSLVSIGFIAAGILTLTRESGAAPGVAGLVQSGMRIRTARAGQAGVAERYERSATLKEQELKLSAARHNLNVDKHTARVQGLI